MIGALKRVMASRKTARTPKADVKPAAGAAVSVARPAVPTPVKARAVAEPTREEISSRAFQIWEQTGRAPGRDVENWLRAEAELRGRR